MICTKLPWQRIIRWFTRPVVGVSLVALLLLAYLALWSDPQLSSRRKHSIGDDGPGIGAHEAGVAGFDRHYPGSQHDHGHAATAFTHTRLVFIIYSVFVHFLAFAFPLRACFSIIYLTRRVKAANLRYVSHQRLASTTTAAAAPRLPLSDTLAHPPISSSEGSWGSSPAESEYEADDEDLVTKVIHAIILPNYKEDLDTLTETLEVLASHTQARRYYDVFIAMEEREQGSAAKAHSLCSQFRRLFRSINYIMHPNGIPGEAPGKSSNLSWAAKEISSKYSSPMKPALLENIIVTVMDADSFLSSNYFSLVTSMHIRHAHTAQTSMYIPPIIFDRNCNSVPHLVRIADIFWCAAGISGLYPQAVICPPTSVYSLPLTLVDRVGGWDAGPEAIGEDLHMYLKCFFALSGNLTARIVPSPASQSNVSAGNDVGGIRGWIEAIKARYVQAIRHMWGSLDSGFAIRSLIQLCWYRQTLEDGNMFSEYNPLSSHDATTESRCSIDSGQDIPQSVAKPLKPNWLSILVLCERLFEAHFLPVHLTILPLAAALYTLLPPTTTLSPELNWVFNLTGYLRLLGSLGMLLYLSLYEDFHSLCVSAREEEMQWGGLAGKMRGGFTHRGWWPNVCDYLMFPLALLAFGPVPALHAQVKQFWTVRLDYTVSLKPKNVAKSAANLAGLIEKIV